MSEASPASFLSPRRLPNGDQAMVPQTTPLLIAQSPSAVSPASSTTPAVGFDPLYGWLLCWAIVYIGGLGVILKRGGRLQWLPLPGFQQLCQRHPSTSPSRPEATVDPQPIAIAPDRSPSVLIEESEQSADADQKAIALSPAPIHPPNPAEETLEPLWANEGVIEPLRNLFLDPESLSRLETLPSTPVSQPSPCEPSQPAADPPSAIGLKIGTFPIHASDGQPYIYTLVTNPQQGFVLQANELYAIADFLQQLETEAEYTLTIQRRDAQGNVIHKSFVVQLSKPEVPSA